LEVAQKQLIETEKLKALTEITGATAHEISQPLARVMGFLELALSLTETDDERHILLQDAVVGAKRMADLLNQIRNIRTYETKTYLGSTRIVDFEASAQTEG
jgi:signal transduction histidine kinase